MSRLPVHPAGLIDQGPGVPPPPSAEAGMGAVLRAGTTATPVAVVEVQNDYLSCKKIDADGKVVGDAFPVAKPPKLRHQAAQYPTATITTVGAQTIDAVGEVDENEVEERWIVTPPYFASGLATPSPTALILVARCPGALAAEEVGGETVDWIDLNVDARAWSTNS